ncbi:hypothetical protein ACJRO7_006439 [Eucalyptus globulus]|uniref:Protein kinase domain-containing protein n=1 Tax=Eucalyptus globulus TaxID=34317 RepID=A0ABD3IN80_EUCGL
MPKDQLLFLLFLLLLHLSFSIALENNQCTSSCGDNNNISYPFRLRGDPDFCGDPNCELACLNNRTILNLYSSKYYVQYIDYTNYTIRVADVGMTEDNCSPLSLRSLSCREFSEHDPYSCTGRGLYKSVSIVNCTKVAASQFYIDASSCHDRIEFSNFSSPRRRLYAMIDANASNVETACTIELLAMIPWWADGDSLHSYAQIQDLMVFGFELSWLPMAAKMQCKHHVWWAVSGKYQIWCSTTKGIYILLLYSRITLMLMLLATGAFTVVKFILGAPCVMMLLIHKWRRRHLAMDQNVEEFLQSNNNFLPIRYSYSKIKKITSGLKDKLGEGGYGSVFKGKLRSGRDVAVKILKNGKANGQDFISEVATIGRIHHVNVVGLIGFCFEGSKQALVYDFMHNGSLDKHIFSRGQGTYLDCKEVYKIALGVSRGIKYLHRGCDMQILHFDIKPHNILLDKDLTPKVSDFGLARLYSPDHNTVSLTAARGTLGYMAPELVYKNIGSISYKADVYSFGKLLMEMASRRKNADTVAGCPSDIYFPLWVHDQLSEGSNVPMEEVSEEDKIIVEKMIIVALWCIQLNPSDRPSMHKVLEMLEGEAGGLQVPPKPLLYPMEMSTRDDETWTDKGNDTISTSSISATTYEASHLEHASITIRQA